MKQAKGQSPLAQIQWPTNGISSPKSKQRPSFDQAGGRATLSAQCHAPRHFYYFQPARIYGRVSSEACLLSRTTRQTTCVLLWTNLETALAGPQDACLPFYTRTSPEARMATNKPRHLFSVLFPLFLISSHLTCGCLSRASCPSREQRGCARRSA